MEAIKMEEFIKKARREFRKLLKNNADNMEKMKAFIREKFENCCGDFEEQTLIENLQEELSNLKKI